MLLFILLLLLPLPLRSGECVYRGEELQIPPKPERVVYKYTSGFL